jgi:uncharacterized protein YgbK (DUF1537 family)
MDHKLLFAYYGDDFTGSSDVMEVLTFNGVPTALFLEPPTQEELDNFRLKYHPQEVSARLKAFGVAGVSRTMSPEEMDTALPPLFEAISRIPTSFFQYKVCSTFDSSPQTGSIGHATDLAYEHFPSYFIPLLVGAPFLNRFSLFGNLFARVGEETYRLDRHPTMSQHPVTPMQESDLRLHLQKQSYRKVNLFDVFALELPQAQRHEKFQRMLNLQGEFMLFDVLNDSHLLHAGELMCGFGEKNGQLLVGSSGLTYAIMLCLQKAGVIEKPETPASPGRAERVIAIAGSASPATHGQILTAQATGFAGLAMDTLAMLEPEAREKEKARLFRQALDLLQEGRSIVLYSALGPDDPQLLQTRARMREMGIPEAQASALFAAEQGEILARLIPESGVKRVVVAGGDTSGQVARALGIYALEARMPIAPGAPLCLAHSKLPAIDGLQIALKGGQNGNARYFEAIREGVFLPV